MIKKAFYFEVKSLSVLEIFSFFSLHFCPDILVMQKSDLIRKLQLITKFITSETGQKIIPMHILPNISRSKNNHAMKFFQLTENYMRNLFLEKLYAKYGGETSPRRLYEKQKLSISLDQQYECYQVCFYCMSMPRSTKIF